MRFTHEQLDAFFIDATRDAWWSPCPFCGGTVVLGHRKDTGNQTLAHSAVADPTKPGSLLAGCERFTEVATVNVYEFMKLFRAAGGRLRNLTE